jgi:hypothetical protein
VTVEFAARLAVCCFDSNDTGVMSESSVVGGGGAAGGTAVTVTVVWCGQWGRWDGRSGTRLALQLLGAGFPVIFVEDRTNVMAKGWQWSESDERTYVRIEALLLSLQT